MIGRLVKVALRLRSRSLPGSAASSPLVIAPHPDDETLGCGGTVALLAQNRAAVHVLFVTDGSASHPAHPTLSPSDGAARCKAEARSATGTLGVDPERIVFLDMRGGTLAELGEERARDVEEGIAGMVARLAPQVILLPCRRDGSSEHDASFALVYRALQHARPRPRTLEFPVWSWWNPLLLLRPMFACRTVWRIDIRGVLDVKARAIASYASQTDPIAPDPLPALPLGFASMFLCGEEYLFER
jgi:LmbE family N-acetylglucosaminyl deacetylase